MKINECNVNIPAEKFRLVGDEKVITDKSFDTKPIGYFKDAFIRFKKNKSSLVAAVIIVVLVAYAILVPVFCSNNYTNSINDNTYNEYSKLLPKSKLFAWAGWDGGHDITINSKSYLTYVAIEQETGLSPIIKTYKADYVDPKSTTGSTYYDIRVDSYIENDKTYTYKTLTLEEYLNIQQWQNENNIQVIFPAVDTSKLPSNFRNDAKIYYETDEKGRVKLTNGEIVPLYLTSYQHDDMYNSIRIDGDDGSYVYAKISDAADLDGNVVRSYQVRVFQYNYFIYRYGEEPSFLFGTDGKGYDILTRLAQGARFSFIFAVVIASINLFIGAVIGSLEGYYGGLFDLIMERFIEILSGVPFIVVATLFQLHLAKRVGAIPSLLLAFVLTGWIGVSGTVRMQFYRFKGQEYILSARTLGAGDGRLMFKHIFPNSLGTIITSCVLIIPGVIFSESSLTYLGIVNLDSSTLTSVGTLIANSRQFISTYPHIVLFPALFISLLEISFNLFGNGLRDAFNPSLRGVEE